MRRRRERARDDEFGLLLGPLLESEVFEAKVLPGLSVKDLFALAGVNRASRRALAEVEGMKWMRSGEERWNEGRCRVKYDACTWAASDGRLDVLQWARAHGCEWNWQTCARAAWGGHLAVLKWARENGCEWDELTCAWAAQGGHLEVVRWARANGCHWDEWTCAYAAGGGHMEVLKWARANGCKWESDTCAIATIFFPRCR